MTPEAQRVAIAEGARVGRLTVLYKSHQNPCRNWLWVCACDCGKTRTILGVSLSTGHTLSCGCLRSETTRQNKTIHGNARRKGHTPEYRAWRGILSRCLSETNPAYADYGGRGISVCQKWANSFESFLTDMGRKPSPAHSIDRINNDGNYEPSNCRWATTKEQSANRRKRRWKKKP